MSLDKAVKVDTAIKAGEKAGADNGGAGFWRDDNVRRNLALVGVLVVLILIGIITRPDLYSDSTWVRNNVFSILELASVVGVVTVGMTFVIIGGGIDLSVGAIIAL
ncbi:MAG TPA: ABC transporter permease, partial [Micromonosporaceae bacterium]|nr:ABC transporter permease [Micromonosporaceae bacterium]